MNNLSAGETKTKTFAEKKIIFISDFPSPADETKKAKSNNELHKYRASIIYSSCYSENWFG
jgi:hypothetical protein